MSLNNIGEASFTIQNIGNASLTFSYSNSNANQFSVIPSTLGPLNSGQTALIRVRFQPTGLGSQSTTLTITSNDPATPIANVSVSGRAVPAASLPAGQSFTQTATIQLPGTGSPAYLNISGGKAYVAMANQLGVVDLTTGSPTGLVTFSAYPSAGAGVPAVVGTKAYVPLSNLSPSNQLAVVDLTANTVSQYVPVAVGSYGTAVWSTEVYIQQNACWNDGHADVVQVFDTISNTVTESLQVNQSATGIAIDPQTGRGDVSGDRVRALAALLLR